MATSAEANLEEEGNDTATVDDNQSKTGASCARCRNPLLTQEQVEHAHGYMDRCHSLMLAECVRWMLEQQPGKQQGKLNCPFCSQRVGAFAWHGLCCDCGQWVVPAFQLQRSKIDLSLHP